MAHDDARRNAAYEIERTDKLYRSFREGDLTAPYWLYDIPLGAAGSRTPRERTEPLTVEQQFREHKRLLLDYLERVYSFLLPEELCQDWARRIEPLDLAQPEVGVVAIAAIRQEYERAFYRYEPPNTEVSTRGSWDERVPRIGREIEWVEWLLRQMLPPE